MSIDDVKLNIQSEPSVFINTPPSNSETEQFVKKSNNLPRKRGNNDNADEPNNKFFKRGPKEASNSGKADKTNLQFMEKMVVRNIIRTDGVNKNEAVLKMLQERRVKPRLEIDKTVVAKDQMPWQPKILNLPRKSISNLMADDHRRYVALLLNYLTPTINFRFQMNKYELDGWDERLKFERAKYETLARNIIYKYKYSPFRKVPNGAFDFFKTKEQAKIESVLKGLNFDLRKPVTQLSWNTRLPQMGSTNNYNLKVTNVLNPGHAPRIQIPDVRRKCEFDMGVESIEKYFDAVNKNKTPILDDEEALNLALENEVEFIIDGSTLRHLLCDPWTYRKQNFVNRISIVRRIHKNSTIRVIYISRTLLNSQLDFLYLNRQFTKWVVKTGIKKRFLNEKAAHSKIRNFQRRNAIEKKKAEIETVDKTTNPSLSTSNNLKSGENEIETETQEIVEKNVEVDQNDNEDMLQIADDEENVQSNIRDEKAKTNDFLGGILDRMISNTDSSLINSTLTASNPSNDIIENILDLQSNNSIKKFRKEKPKKHCTEETKKQPISNSVGSTDLLGNIFDSMDSSLFSSQTSKLSNSSELLSGIGQTKLARKFPSKILKDENPQSMSQKRYAIVNLDSEDKHRFLVRTTNHGTDQHGQTIALTVKPEFLTEIGSDKLHIEEQLWNMITCILKGPDEWLNAHMHVRNGNCVQLRRNGARHAFANVDTSLRNLLHLRSERVCRLMNVLEKLDIGEYLIVPPDMHSEASDERFLRILGEIDPNSNSGHLQNSQQFSSLKDSIAPTWPMEKEGISNSEDIGADTIFGNAPNPAISDAVLNSETMFQRCFGTNQIAMHNCDTLFSVVESFDNDKNASEKAIAKEYDAIWAGVDPHLPLMWHVIQSRIPGSLYPRRKPINEMQNNARRNFKAGNSSKNNDQQENDGNQSENASANNAKNGEEKNNAKMSKSANRRLRRKQQRFGN